MQLSPISISLDKHTTTYVATAAEVSQVRSYVVWRSELAKLQQAHVVIEIYY